jgi:hypothetical protein
MSTPEVITVNSEALEAKVTELLPSQNGFGSELQASNVIMPIIDLTATASGSGLRSDLERALSFNSQTAFEANGSTEVLANSTGFFRITGFMTMLTDSSTAASIIFTMTDGSTTKTVAGFTISANSVKLAVSESFDFTVFLPAGHSISCTSNGGGSFALGSTRQVATVTGTLVNPSGFVAE